MSDNIKPVAFRVDYPAENSIGRCRFFGAGEVSRMRIHAQSDGVVNPLYDADSLDAARREAIEQCAGMVASAAPGFCGGRAEIVLYTLADSIRALLSKETT